MNPRLTGGRGRGSQTHQPKAANCTASRTGDRDAPQVVDESDQRDERASDQERGREVRRHVAAGIHDADRDQHGDDDRQTAAARRRAAHESSGIRHIDHAARQCEAPNHAGQQHRGDEHRRENQHALSGPRAAPADRYQAAVR